LEDRVLENGVLRVYENGVLKDQVLENQVLEDRVLQPWSLGESWRIESFWRNETVLKDGVLKVRVLEDGLRMTVRSLKMEYQEMGRTNYTACEAIIRIILVHLHQVIR